MYVKIQVLESSTLWPLFNGAVASGPRNSALWSWGIRHYGGDHLESIDPRKPVVSETFSMGALTSEVSMWCFRAVGHWVKGLIGWVPLPHCDLCYVPRRLSQYPI